MSLRWVSAAQARPHRCAFLPVVGSHDPEGFFDFGTEIMAFDGHAYCSVKAAKQMAEKMGWQPVDHAGQQRMAAKLNEAEGRVAAAEAELAALREKFDAIDVLASEGFTARKRPGRPVKDKAAA